MMCMERLDVGEVRVLVFLLVGQYTKVDPIAIGSNY